jgi:hypothetical protein
VWESCLEGESNFIFHGTGRELEKHIYEYINVFKHIHGNLSSSRSWKEPFEFSAVLHPFLRKEDRMRVLNCIRKL